jgi:hypothetical protein
MRSTVIYRVIFTFASDENETSRGRINKRKVEIK